MDRDGIKKTALFGYHGMNFYPEENQQDIEIIEFSRANPDRILPFICDFDFYDEKAPEYVEQLAEDGGVYGVGEVLFGHTPMRRQVFTQKQIDDDRPIEVFKAAGRCGLPVLIHADRAFRPELENAIRCCPDTNFIWAHIAYDFMAEYGGAASEISYIKKLVNDFSNVYFDISHWKISPIYLCSEDWQHLLEDSFDRFIFGMDMSEDYMLEGLWFSTYKAVLSGLSCKAQQSILAGNFMRLICLPM